MAMPAIRVEGLGKRYRLSHNRERARYRTLRESLTGLVAAPFKKRSTVEEFWALNDVSFEVQPGEVVGIIGRNGAGKSTLLKVLSRVTKPTTGCVEINGRVGSLLEVGTGFHPELTGRENIYLNGSILGMNRKEIARKFDEIVAFAEVEQFLDTPVKRYSSGMYVRLAFAVAAHLDIETVIIDEVLAVGDLAFQKKCHGKMAALAQSGRTVLLVSHDMAAILSMCRRVAVLEKGRVGFLGPTAAAIERFMDSATDSNGEVSLINHPHRHPGCTTLFQRVRLINRQGKRTSQFMAGESMTIELEVDGSKTLDEMDFDIWVSDSLGCRLFTVSTSLSDAGPLLVEGMRNVQCHVDQQLAPGRYCLAIRARVPHRPPLDSVYKVAWFDVIAGDFYGNGRAPQASDGRFLVRSTWRLAVSE